MMLITNFCLESLLTKGTKEMLKENFAFSSGAGLFLVSLCVYGNRMCHLLHSNMCFADVQNGLNVQTEEQGGEHQARREIALLKSCNSSTKCILRSTARNTYSNVSLFGFLNPFDQRGAAFRLGMNPQTIYFTIP